MTTPLSSRINSIECLRGISALLVVCYHYREFLNDITPKLGHMLFENGRIGVDIFFVLSGFAIYLSTQAPSEQGVLRFLLRRFFRIVPLAWLLMAVVWLITPSISAWATLKSVLFIPLSPESAPFFGYNILPVAWTLTYELCFYALFALALGAAPRQRGLVVTALVLGMVGLLQWHSGQSLSMDAYQDGIFKTLHLGPLWVGIFANPLFFEFLCGVLLAWLYIHQMPVLAKIPVPVRTALYLFLLAFFIHPVSAAASHAPLKTLGALHCRPALRPLATVRSLAKQTPIFRANANANCRRCPCRYSPQADAPRHARTNACCGADESRPTPPPAAAGRGALPRQRPAPHCPACPAPAPLAAHARAAHPAPA